MAAKRIVINYQMEMVTEDDIGVDFNGEVLCQMKKSFFQP